MVLQLPGNPNPIISGDDFDTSKPTWYVLQDYQNPRDTRSWLHQNHPNAGKAWSGCTKSCSEGTQVRRVKCMIGGDNLLGSAFIENESECGPLPEITRVCNTQACKDSGETEWVPLSWGSCDKSCGGGSQESTLGICRTQGTQQILLNEVCKGNFASNPISRRVCNTESCDSKPQRNKQITTLAAGGEQDVVKDDDLTNPLVLIGGIGLVGIVGIFFLFILVLKRKSR